MNVILIGYGNVGKEVQRVLEENKIKTRYIFRSDGIYNSDNLKIDDNENFSKYINSKSAVFISTPSVGEGELSSEYYLKSLDHGAIIITCEKAFLANNWEVVKKYPDRIKYSATVGGDSGILNATQVYRKEIKDIKAVVNGTLNYISDRLVERVSEEVLFQEVKDNGFAEPGSKNFQEVLDAELKDVGLKATILANHSGLYGTIIKPENISITIIQEVHRSGVILNKDGIQAGFVLPENSIEFPRGVNNVLYINGEKLVEGAGAGARATAERMFKDFKEFN